MARLATAAVLAPLLWLTIKRAPPLLFVVLSIGVILAACWELYRMLRQRGAQPFVWLGLALAAALLVAYSYTERMIEPRMVLAVAALVVSLGAMRFRSDPGQMLETIVQTLFPIVFVALTMGYVIALRGIADPLGSDLVLLLFICVIFGDTAAYYVGTLVGRHRLAPKISPNKTWEGAVGALVGSVLGAGVAHAWFYQSLPLRHVVPVGVVLGAAGLLGDLSESVIKRACGVKDSSSLLPGHGGCLDRTDNLLFSAPILFYYYQLFLGRPL